MRTLILVTLVLATALVPLATADIHVYNCNSAGQGCYESDTVPGPIHCDLYTPHPGANRVSHCDGIGR